MTENYWSTGISSLQPLSDLYRYNTVWLSIIPFVINAFGKFAWVKHHDFLLLSNVVFAHIPLLRNSPININGMKTSSTFSIQMLALDRTELVFSSKQGIWNTYIFPVVANVCSYWPTSVGTPKLPAERNVLAALNGTPQRLIPYQIRVVKRSVGHCVVFHAWVITVKQG